MTPTALVPPPDVLQGSALFLAAHASATYDLAQEPWIPVMYRDGTRANIGARDLFTASHTILDITESDPLVRAALRRYLTALTARLVLLPGSPDKFAWLSRLDASTGFTSDEVEALITDQREHLWLFHPRTPFMQDGRFLQPARKFDSNWETNSDELLTPLPGSTSRAWAFKPGDLGVDSGLTWDRAARAVVARWYYGLLGRGGGGDMGGAFPNGTSDAPLTHAFRVDPAGLFGTLLRNIAKFVIESPRSPMTGLAWADPRHPSTGGDGLYRYSTTATACLLGPVASDARIHQALRGSIDDPAGSKETRKVAKQAAREDDPHRIRRTLDAKGKPRSDVRLSAFEPPLRRLAVLRRGIIEAGNVSATGVVRENDLWLSDATRRRDETLELTLANLAGSATSPQWAAAATVALPAAHLDPEWSRSIDLDALIDIGFGERGVYPTIRYAITSVFRGQEDPKKSMVGAPLAAAAHRRWLAAAETITAEALSGTRSLEEAEAALWKVGRDAVSAVLAPYASTTRYAGGVVQAVAAVRSRT